MSAFPRRAGIERTVLVTSVLALVLIAAMSVAAHWLREPLAPRAERLPVAFPHRKHADTSCPVCHHNMRDKSGPGVACIHCHRSDHPDLERGIMGEFHDFCMGCHAKKARTLAKHGPVRECAGCHVATTDGFMP